MLLALDTATSGCSVAILQAGQILAHASEAMARGQSEALVPMIDRVLKEAGVTLDQMERIAVTRGPGAFTGLRIGLATARALALARSIPCIGVETLEVLAAMAKAAGHPGPFLVAIDSKRGDLYTQAFDAQCEPATQPAALNPDLIPGVALAALGATGAVTLVGDAQDKMRTRLETTGWDATPTSISTPEAWMVGQLAIARAPDRFTPVPLYLRAADAALPVRGGRLR